MPLPSAYRYEIPEDVGNVKDLVDIWSTEVLSVQVQVVRHGGETNLHAHVGFDSMWFVLSGKAAFYDEDERKYVLNQHEMIALPSGTKYWFESIGDEPLEVLHIVGRDPRTKQERVDVTPLPERVGRIPHTQAKRLEPLEA